MAFNERISVVIDVVTDKASASLGGFRKSIGDADGAAGKLKAGWQSVSSSISANASALSIAAGGALVAFGVKSANALADVAKAAVDLSTSTGLTIEQASRWIGVADDYQVGADALATGLGKIAKTMDDTKWADYGIATRDAGGEALAVNDILLSTFDMLSKIDNKTEQARVGQELFGKGYQSLTPILGQTRAEYEKMLGAVDKGQVVTEEEAARAEKWRLANDNLKDGLAEVSLALGDMFVAGAPVLNLVAELAKKVAYLTSVATGSDAKSMSEPIREFSNAVKGLGGGRDDIVKVLNALDTLRIASGDAQSSMGKTADVANVVWQEMVGGGGAAADKMENLRAALDALWKINPGGVTIALEALQDLNYAAEQGNKDAQEQMATRGLTADSIAALADRYTQATTATDEHTAATDEAAAAEVRMSGDTRKAKDAMTGLAGETAGATREIQTLKGEIDDEQAWLDMLDTLDAYKLKMNDATASDREKQRAGLAVQEELIGRLEAIENLPPEKTTEILTLIDQGKYDEAAWAIGVLTAERTINLKFGQIGPMPHLPGQKLASGTNSARPGVALVGEEGPELVIFKGGESVIPADRTAQMAANAANLAASKQAGFFDYMNQFNAQGDAGIAARAAAAGSGSGNTYNVTVNGANMSADDIVRAIKEWERRNGTGWRS